MNKKEEILIGKTLNEAQEILRNCHYRIINEDTKPLKSNPRSDRYNLYMEKGIIVKVDFG